MKCITRGQFRRWLLGSTLFALVGASVQAQQPESKPRSQPVQEVFLVNPQLKPPQNDQKNASENKKENPKENLKEPKQVENYYGLVKRLGEGAAAAEFQDAAQTSTFFYLRGPQDNLLGVNLSPPDGSVRAQLGIPEDRGLVVTSLLAEGPAAKVGLAANDIILMVGEKPVASAGDISEALKVASEKVVGVKVLRAGKEAVLNVRSVPRVTWAPAAEKVKTFFIGLGAAPIDETLQVHLGLPKNQGLLAKEIVTESPAEKSGLKTYDILIDVNGRSLDQADTLQKVVQESQGQPVKFKLIRAGKPLNIMVTPETRECEADSAIATGLMLLSRDTALYQNTANGIWTEIAAGSTAANGVGNGVQAQYDFSKTARFVPTDVLLTQPLLTAYGAGLTVNVPADPAQALTARIDRLESEIKAIKSAVESIRDALKK